MFSEKLKELLKINNMSQSDLCKKTGIQSSLMANYYSGKKSPALSNAISIADAFNVTLDELVGRNTMGLVNEEDVDINKHIIDKFLKLSDRNKYRIEGKIDDYLLEQIKTINNEISATDEKKIEEKVELYRNELVNEQKGATLLVSRNTKEKIS